MGGPISGIFETSPLFANDGFCNGRKGRAKRQNSATYADGTICVPIPLYSSCGAFLHKGGRGGARNRADRDSDALTAIDLDKIISGMLHAKRIGVVPNRMTTIHWEQAGVQLSNMVAATGKFIDAQTRFVKRHGYETVAIYCHEGGDKKGGHCHLMQRVPLDIADGIIWRQRRWIQRITGQTYVKGVIKNDPIGRRLDMEETNPALFEANLTTVIGYLCKGAPQALLDAYGINRQHEYGGLVIGKRCGVSQNIGPAAQAKWMESYGG